MMTGLEKLRADLDWRTPSGKPQGYVVLERGQAQEVLHQIEALQAAVAHVRSRSAPAAEILNEFEATRREAIKSMVAESQKLKLP